MNRGTPRSAQSRARSARGVARRARARAYRDERDDVTCRPESFASLKYELHELPALRVTSAGRAPGGRVITSDAWPTESMTTLSTECLELQTALAGEYSLERELGRGGMGVVYLARDVQLDRHVAIKVLPLHLAEQPEARERFLREARTAAGLSHPHVVPIHRVGEASGSPSDNRTAICDHTSGNGRRARCVTHCVFSLRYGRLRVTLRGRDGLWPAIVAMALTSASFASVLLSIRQPGAW